MICPKCGADNEAGARFCEECGAPLDNPVDLPPPLESADEDDRTILSSLSRLAEEAKTVSVTQEQLAEAEAAASTPFRPEPPPPPPLSSSGGSSDSGQGWMTQRNMIIIGVVIVVLLLCCCCSVIVGGIMANPEIMDELDISMITRLLVSI